MYYCIYTIIIWCVQIFGEYLLRFANIVTHPASYLQQVMDKRVAVFDSNGNSVESQLVPIASVSIGIRNFYTKAHVGKSSNATPKYWLAFTASVPPLGFRTYVVSTPKGAG